MEQYGDKVITQIVIQRAPIKTVPVDRLMNLITNGNFNKSLQASGNRLIANLKKQRKKGAILAWRNQKKNMKPCLIRLIRVFKPCSLDSQT